MSRYGDYSENNLFEIDSREFLNKNNGMAAYNVKGEIGLEKWTNTKTDKEEQRLSNWCELTISDCTRQINLDFSIGESFFDKDYENAIHKLSKLREALDSVAMFLLQVKEERDKIVPSKDETLVE